MIQLLMVGLALTYETVAHALGLPHVEVQGLVTVLDTTTAGWWRRV